MDAKVIDVAVGKLVPAPWQREVDEKSEKFADLLAAVKADGVRKALDVRPRGGCDEDGYEVLDGGRRLRAATIAKLKTVPCIVHSWLTDAEACDLTYLAFLGREDLTPLQEGKAIAELLERHGDDAAAVASVVGKTVRWVRMRANLRWLTKKWRKLAADASWTAAHLALVARLPAAVQDDLIKTDCDYEQRCEDSVKELAARINEKYLRLLSKAPWNLDDATLVPEMGACSACTQRSSQEGLLFHEADELEPDKVAAVDKCLRADCWAKKAGEHVGRRFAELKAEHKDLHVVAEKYLGYLEEKEVAKAFPGCKMIDTSDHFTRVKAGTAGAVPAMSITGASAGELHWIKAAKQGSGQGPGGREQGTARKTTLKERRAKLEKRRTAKVIKDVLGMLKDSRWTSVAPSWMDASGKSIDCWSALTALSAVFGIAGYSYVNNKRDKRGWKEADRLGLNIGELQEEMWNQVRDTLAGDLNGFLNNLQEHNLAAALAFAERACGLIAVDFKLLVEEAKAEIPEPKGWAKLNPDGSGKTAVTAKKKRTAKKKAGEKTVNGVCRKCGCTEAAACQTDEGPCYWVYPDLCSACATQKQINAAVFGPEQTPKAAAKKPAKSAVTTGAADFGRTLILKDKVRGRAAGQHDGVVELGKAKGGKIRVRFADGKTQSISARLMTWK